MAETWYLEGVVTHDQKKRLYSAVLDWERVEGDVCMFLGFSQEELKGTSNPFFDVANKLLGHKSDWDELKEKLSDLDKKRKMVFDICQEIGAYPG